MCPGIVLGLAAAATLSAATYNWANDAGGNWNAVASWGATDYPRLAGDVANFTNDITADRTVTVNLGGAERVGTVTLTDATAGSNWILSGGTLSFSNSGAGATLNSTTGANSTTSSITLYDNLTVNTTGTSLLLNSPISLGAYNLTVTGSGVTTIDKNFGYGAILISGTGGLIVDGGGTLRVSAKNNTCNYTGNTEVRNGTLRPWDSSGTGSVVAPLPVGTRLILGSGTNSGTFDLGYNQTVAGLATSGTGTANTITSSDAAARTFTLNNLSNDSFSGQITGNLVFIKNNTGSLTLSGAGGYSGATTFGNGGAVTLDFASNNTGKLGVGATTLQGMDLSMNGNAAAPSSQNLNNTTFNTGRTTVSVTANGGQTATLNLGTITRTAPATVAFTPPAAGSITTTTAVTNGILGGYATVGSNWATKSGSDIVGLSAYAAFTASGTNTNNELLTGSGSVSGAKTTNSLKLDSSGAGQSLDLGVNNLVLSSRGLLFAGANNYAITGTGSLGGSGNEMLVHAMGAGTLSIAAPISGGAGSLVKTGAGILELAGTSAYTGATTISQGTLRLGTANPLSASTVITVNAGATWNLNGNSQTVAGIVGMGTINPNGATLTCNTSATQTFSGLLQGTGSVVKTGSSALYYSGTVNNTFSGTTTVNAGDLYLNRPGYTSIAGDLVVGDGTGTDRVFSDYVSNQIADTATVTLNTSGYYRLYPDASGKSYETMGRLVVNGSSTAFVNADIPSGSWLTVNALEMTGGVISIGESTWNPGYVILGGNVTSHASATPAEIRSTTGGNAPGAIDLNGATRTFTVENGAADADLNIGTRIQTSSGTAGIIKDGPGNLAFTQISNVQANHTYNGPTEIREGKVTIGRANHLPTGTTLTLGDASNHSASLELNGFSQQVTALGTVGTGAANAITNSTATAVTLTVNQATTTVFDGAINGPIALSKSGAGSLTIGGNGTYTGVTTLSAGTLAVTAAAGMGNSPTIQFTDNGTGLLRLVNDGSGNNGTIVYGGASLPNGHDVALGTGNANSAAAIEVGPLTTNTGNAIQLNNLTLGTVSGWNKTLTVTGSNGYSLKFAGTTTIGGGATHLISNTGNLILNNVSMTGGLLSLEGTAGASAVLGAISGGYGVNKSGTGTWTLAGASSYTGVNAVSNGTLVVTAATGGLGNGTAANTVDLSSNNNPVLSLLNDGAGSNGTVIFGSAANPTGYNVNFNNGNAIASATINVGHLAANTGNTVQFNNLTIGNAAGYTRTLTITGTDGYRLSFAGTVTPAGPTAVLNPTTASLLLNNVSLAAAGITLGGTAAGNMVTGSITGGNAVTKSGTGMWTLSGTNSYSGATTVSGGTLQFNQLASIGGTGRTVNPAASTTVAAGYAIDNTFLTRLTDNDADAYVVALAADSANPLDFNSTTGSRLTNASLGAVGAASYTGTLTPNGTAYRLGGGGGTLSLPSDGALSGARSLSVTASGTAGGTVILGGADTYTLATTVNSGMRLLVNGSLSSGGGLVTVNSGATLGGTGTINRSVTTTGDIAPGASLGTLSVVGNVTFGDNSNLVIEGGRDSASDLLQITGNLDLTSVLDKLSLVSLLAGGDLQAPYVLATFTGTRASVFDSVWLNGVQITDPTAAGALSTRYNLYYGPNSIELVPEPLSLGLLAAGSLALAARRRR